LSTEGLLEILFTLAFKGLVYPQIWEDPEIDMEALALTPDCQVVAIASGGSNILSYLTAQPGRITAVVQQGPFLKVTIDCGVRIVATVSGHVSRELAVEPGCAVTIVLRPADLYVIPRG
jgi:ABC-type molybdate transport system ATPase subunit